MRIFLLLKQLLCLPVFGGDASAVGPLTIVNRMSIMLTETWLPIIAREQRRDVFITAMS